MTGFMPISNMQTGNVSQDSGYLRQNQLLGQNRTAKPASFASSLPNNEQLQMMVGSAKELQKQNMNLDRGSILDILA